MRRHPHLYEVNVRLFIKRLSEKYHRALTLATVPEEEWQLLNRRGFDMVWLMGYGSAARVLGSKRCLTRLSARVCSSPTRLDR